MFDSVRQIIGWGASIATGVFCGLSAAVAYQDVYSSVVSAWLGTWVDLKLFVGEC